nr:MAG TPA: hypothetical protein [Caudoviricetes sp.]
MFSAKLDSLLKRKLHNLCFLLQYINRVRTALVRLSLHSCYVPSQTLLGPMHCCVGLLPSCTSPPLFDK